MKFKITYATEQPNQLKICDPLTEQAWPTFMLNSPVSNTRWAMLYDLLPEYQFTFTNEENNEIVAIANTIPLSYTDKFENFPKEGWDFILRKGVDDYNDKIKPNIMSALSIVITPNYLGKGVSRLVVEEMRKIGISKNFSSLIAPVRPNLKTLYPLIPIEEYIHWKNKAGNQFDAWLRVHESVGGKIVKVCHEAMRIPGTIDEWESWADMKFPATGQYTVKGALVPITIDRESNSGLYIEPNVLFVHSLA